MTSNTSKLLNGFNLEAVLGAREALSVAPEGAMFIWRAQSRWMNGTHTESAVNRFFGLGEEQEHLREFIYDTDHPEIFAAEDEGPTPVEMVLVGLAGCLTAGVASVASNRNIELHSVNATLEAGMDIQGIMGLDSDVRNGFENVKVAFDIEADASDEDIEAIVAQSQKRSAVYDIIANPTNVVVSVNS
ncbi:MAG: OsmC family protein [Pseudomonadota bacterium]